MTLLGKIFGGKKKGQKDGAVGLLEEILDGFLKVSGFDLSFEATTDGSDDEIIVEFFGADEELLIQKEGQLLDAINLYVKRVLQHQLPEERINVEVDCAGFRKQANDALIELADKLREIALSKGKSVYFRALPPKDRKIVHQYLAEDGRVKSRSIGDGHFKKIRIYPAKNSEDGVNGNRL